MESFDRYGTVSGTGRSQTRCASRMDPRSKTFRITNSADYPRRGYRGGPYADRRSIDQPRRFHRWSSRSAAAGSNSGSDNTSQGFEMDTGRLVKRLKGDVSPDDVDTSGISMSIPGTGAGRTHHERPLLTATAPASSSTPEIRPGFDLFEASCLDALASSTEQCLSLIASLGTDLQSHLLDRYWKFFNASTPIVHKAAFLAHLDEGYGSFCSPELHLAVLAMGLRRADHSRSDVARLLLPGWDSTLHAQLRQAVNLTRRKSEITYVQSLFLLALLEHERGRDASARLYLYSASTSMHEIQMTQSSIEMQVSDDDLIINRMVSRTIGLVQSHWALFDLSTGGATSALNNPSPTGVPGMFGGMFGLSRQHLGGPVRSFTTNHDLDSETFSAHMELMRIATDGWAELHSHSNKALALASDHSLSLLVDLHDQLKRWYNALPKRLTWCHESKRTASPSLFLLHQQYHTVIIQLFRPFGIAIQESFLRDEHLPSTERGVNVNVTSNNAHTHEITTTIRDILLTSATDITTLLSDFRDRFALGGVLPLMVQQGALAASVFLSDDQYQYPSPGRDHSTRKPCLRHLSFLGRLFSDLSNLQGPADRLAKSCLRLGVFGGGFGEEMTGLESGSLTQSTAAPISAASVSVSDENELLLFSTSRRAVTEQPGRTRNSTTTMTTGQNNISMFDDYTDPGGLTGASGPVSGQLFHSAGTLMVASPPHNVDNPGPGPGSGSHNRSWGPNTPATRNTSVLSSNASVELNHSPQPGPGAGGHLDQLYSNITDPRPSEEAQTQGLDDIEIDAASASASWSETFRALGAVNQRAQAGSQKMSANDYGDVMGCVFQL